MRPRVYVDFDEVLAELHLEWLKRYNAEMGTAHRVMDHWDYPETMEAPALMWSLLGEDDLYEWVDPIPGAIAGMKSLLDSPCEVIVASSCHSNRIAARKMEWLARHGLDVPFVAIKQKWLLRGDVLIDDYQGNLKDFVGRRLLFDRSHNRNAPPSFYNWRCFGWSDVQTQVQTLLSPSVN